MPFFFRRIRITFIFTGLLTFWEKQSKLQKKVKETYLHIQLLPFYPLYTSTLLHLKGKYCTSNSTTFVWQLQLSVTFQITVFLTLPVKEKTFISEFDFIFHFSDILKDKLFLYFFRKFSCVLRQTNSSFVWFAGKSTSQSWISLISKLMESWLFRDWMWLQQAAMPQIYDEPIAYDALLYAAEWGVMKMMLNLK